MGVPVPSAKLVKMTELMVLLVVTGKEVVTGPNPPATRARVLTAPPPLPFTTAKPLPAVVTPGSIEMRKSSVPV
jgi:hypothetical protein